MQPLLSVITVVALLHGVTALYSQAIACPFNDPEHCQPFDDSLNFAAGYFVADDFVASGEALTSVCLWGFYRDQNLTGCVPAAGSDRFRVEVFANDPITGRKPYSSIDDQTETAQRSAVLGSQVQTILGYQMFEMTITLDPPITGLTPGQTYWLKADYDPLSNPPPYCDWHWSQKNQTSSSYSWYSTPYMECDRVHPVAFDYAFCTNFDNGSSPVGAIPGACCTCDGACTEHTLKECEDLGGAWDVNRTSCEGVTCETIGNDNCTDAPVVSEGQYVIPERCATTDGFGPIDTDTGSSQIEGDVWYKFVAPPNCRLSIDTCSTNAACLDSMLAVYHNPENPSVCPPCALMSDPDGAAISSATLAGLGQDESCPGAPIPHVPDNGQWIDTVELGRNALPGECFLIRVGSSPGSRREVDGLLWVDCGDGGDPPSPLAVPTEINKTRFISFTVPASADAPPTQTALRVQLVSLHHEVPAYYEFPIYFTLFEGMSVWVGPPSSYVESVSSGTPFQASFTQCTPHYQDWSTVGLLHVTGSAIVPSSIYSVENVGAACQGHEENCTSVSRGLGMVTTRWGDVETPFNPPSVTVQPDLGDISALVNKFKSVPGAPIKARALLAGIDAFGSMNIALDLGFDDISECVDAFRGKPYPYRMGRCAIGGNACTYNGDCNSTGGPPCVLYCP